MITMILVEDENLERKMLLEHFPWDLIGINIVGEATNGEQGLILAMEKRPDIVLTDVSMPKMNGIQMAEKIRAILPETRILFLSAYDDFDYVKQAIDLNIQAYVMKPVNEAELLRAVKKAADDITERQLEKRMYSRYSESTELARQALVNRKLLGLPTELADERRLKMEWLEPSDSRSAIILGYFPKERTQLVDQAAAELNGKWDRARFHAFSLCPCLGTLLTLFTYETEENVAEIEQTVWSFFLGLGEEELRLQRVDASGELNGFGELYNSTLESPGDRERDKATTEKSYKSRNRIVEDVERIIHEEYAQHLTLESIAKSLHFTPNYLGTVFKTVRKMSVNSYLMQVRMEKACELLRGSSDSVNDIALACGFGSITYFHASFKKNYGQTPQEYRQTARRKK